LQINQNTAVKKKKNEQIFSEYQDNNLNGNNNIGSSSSQMNQSFNSVNSRKNNHPVPIQFNNSAMRGSSELYVWGRN